MAAVHDIFYGPLANGAFVDVRPPIGEIWNVIRFDQWVNTTMHLRTVTYGSLFWDTPAAVGPVWITNDAWARMVSTGTTSSYALYVIKYQAADVPMKVFSQESATAIQVQMRPPVGVDWMLKMAFATGTAARTVSIRNTTLVATGIPYSDPASFGHALATAQGKYGCAISMLVTNSIYAQFSLPATSSFICVYAELAAGVMSPVSGVQSVAVNGFLDVRPPLGEIWTIGAWMGSSTLMTAYDGVTRFTPSLITWSNLKANIQTGNAKWASINVGGAATSVVAWLGWKHPLA